MHHMTDEQKKKCHMIIHGASAAAAGIGAGLAQLPCADTFAITGIQISMVVSLAHVFGIGLTRETAKGLLSAASSGSKGRRAAKTARGISRKMFGWVPVLGNVLNAATAAAITEACGWSAAGSFAEDAARSSVACTV